MSFILPLLAIVSGALAASSVVIKKLPNAVDVIKKLRPYEGFIGASALVMGLLSIASIGKILRMSNILTSSTSIACIGACIVMGFLLGYPVIQDMLLDELSEDARKKSQEMYERLTPYKVTAGLVGIGSGAYLFLISLL